MADLTPTALSSSTRIEPSGIAKFIYLPACSNTDAPTAAEINAGTDLSGEATDWDGWSVDSDTIDAPDLGTTFTAQVPGRTKSDTSTITFFSDKSGVDVRAILPRGTEGFMLKADGGLTEDYKADVFPIRVTSVGKVTKIGDVNQVTVTFAITSEPSEDVDIPAGS